MAKLSSFLNARFLRREKSQTQSLALKQEGETLPNFGALFGMAKSGEKEEAELSELLEKYALHENFDTTEDLSTLLAITSEVKTINNQAAILHGERIKRAQTLLKRYRDGAFTAWLSATYGNRQTPYNFLQYYEFYSRMPKDLHPQIESMPRQAVYTLASRNGEDAVKEEIVRNYQGETKQEMMVKIRSTFPLEENDKRRGNVGDGAISLLARLTASFENPKLTLTAEQKERLHELLSTLRAFVDGA